MKEARGIDVDVRELVEEQAAAVAREGSVRRVGGDPLPQAGKPLGLAESLDLLQRDDCALRGNVRKTETGHGARSVARGPRRVQCRHANERGGTDLTIRRKVDHNRYPRTVLLEAIVRYVTSGA